MGKKTKIGKQRRDKYYRLAKESGFRSRASFKLAQLNRRWSFLQRSRVLLDLCAAPGGWMQVARQVMPVSSLIIGVDLVPIRSVGKGVITIQDDITTDSCKKAIQRELKNTPVDCVLHDGAPNVGQNWLQDAFGQAQLVLSALKLAIPLLRKGGWFVTKVFRSKDHTALLSVFGKLFKRVHVTKPQASRVESAEIFVVCEFYLKPKELDPNLLDPRVVFMETSTSGGAEGEKLTKKLIMNPNKQKKAKAEGYADGATILHNKLPCSQWMASRNHIDLLGVTNEIVLDDERVANHKATTSEIQQCLKDLKLLGRRELKLLLAWRSQMKRAFDEKEVAEIVEVDEAEEVVAETPEAEAEKKKLEEKRADRRLKRKDRQNKKTLREKMSLKMIIPEDRPDIGAEEGEMFSLKTIKSAKAMNDLSTAEPNDVAEDDDEDVSDIEEENDDDHFDDPGPGTSNPLLLDDLDEDPTQTRSERQAQAWFDKILPGENDEDEEDLEWLSDLSEEEDETEDSKEMEKKNVEKKVEEEEEMETDDDLNSDDEEEIGNVAIGELNNPGASEKPKLDAEALALGEALIYSSKTRRDVVDWGFHRFAHNDDDTAPDWFLEDERRHCRKQLPVTKEQVNYYRQREREMNARPIGKVVEAKARKKKRLVNRLEKARKKAEAVHENEEMSEKEKNVETKRIYKGVQKMLKKPPRQYVVAKKGLAKSSGPVKGGGSKYKMVDRRMRSDTRGKKAAEGRKKRGKKRR